MIVREQAPDRTSNGGRVGLMEEGLPIFFGSGIGAATARTGVGATGHKRIWRVLGF